MVKSNEIYLVSTTYEKDKYGVSQATDTSRRVFCEVESVTQNEFFNGGASGFKPEYRFSIFAYDYNDEKEVIFNGVRYVVYRTYRNKSDDIELYVERKQGAN